MQRYKLGALLAAAGVLAVAAPAAAQGTGNVALGLGYGSDGLGPDILFRISPNVVVGARAAAALVTYHKEGKTGDFYFNGNARVNGLSAHIDLHPWTQGAWVAPLYISAGALTGDRHAHTVGVYTGSPFQTSATTFAGKTEIGRIDGDIKISDVSPVLAVGWDNTFTTTHKWGLRLFAGLALADTDVSVRASGGSFSSDPRLTAELSKLEHPLNGGGTVNMRYFPFIASSITYRFGAR